MFSNLKGKTLVNVEVKKDSDGDKLIFMTNDLKVYTMCHYQDCCESVYLEDVVGDLKDLLFTPILVAEESASSTPPEGEEVRSSESETWTFYKLATIKGYVDMRWYGSSNGYYSESVNFREEPDQEDYVRACIAHMEKQQISEEIKPSVIIGSVALNAKETWKI